MNWENSLHRRQFPVLLSILSASTTVGAVGVFERTMNV